MTIKTRILALVTGLVLVLPFALFATAAPEVVPEKEIELRWASIWVGKDSKAAPVAALVEEFNAANAGKIKVVIEPQPDYNAYDQKVRTALASGTAPADIWTMALTSTTSEFYKSDLLMDFTKVMTPEWLARFDAASVRQSTINGVLRMMPYEKAILPVWYNMDLLAKVGVSEVPKTQDEFWSLMNKLKAAGISPTSQMTGDTNAWTSMLWFSHLAVSYGGTNVWSKPFTDPAFVKAAETIKKMITEYSTADAIGLGAGGSGGHFLAGRTAVFSNGPWYTGRADLAATPFFNNIRIAGLPAFGPTSDYMLARLQSSLCAASTKDASREAAMVKFLQFLTDPASVKKIQEASGAMFAIPTDMKPANHLQQQFNDLAGKVKNTATDLDIALGAEVTLEFTQQLSALALGKITPVEFTQLVNQKIDR